MLTKKGKQFFILIVLIIIVLLGMVYYFFLRPNPVKILSSAHQNMQKISNLHFAETFSETKTGEVISKVSGDIIFPNKLSINLTPEINDTQTIIIEGKVYNKWSGKWTLIENKKTEEFNIYNPQSFFYLLSFVSNPSMVKLTKEEKGFRHLKFDVNKEEAQKIFSNKDTDKYQGEIWVNKKDGLISKIAIIFIPKDQSLAPTKYQMEFSDFNDQSLDIKKPI